MKRGWILFVCAVIMIAAGLAGLEAAPMSSAPSPPPLKAGGQEGCGKIGGGFTTAGIRGTIAFDGSCSGYPEESCGIPRL
jgi:hypothetical protein